MQIDANELCLFHSDLRSWKIDINIEKLAFKIERLICISGKLIFTVAKLFSRSWNLICTIGFA